MRGSGDLSRVIEVIAKPPTRADLPIEPLDLERIFGRTAPLHVDLGCGDGAFLADLAKQHPEWNFLGVERLVGRVAKAARKARDLQNVRVLHGETFSFIRYLLPEQSIAAFYLLFPDPWPKRRHHRRRIVTSDFLSSVQLALKPAGTLSIATDHLDYFRQIQRLTCVSAGNGEPQHDRLKRSCSPPFDTVESDSWDLPITKFEKRFRSLGAPIYRLLLRKVSPVA